MHVIIDKLCLRVGYFLIMATYWFFEELNLYNGDITFGLDKDRSDDHCLT